MAFSAIGGAISYDDDYTLHTFLAEDESVGVKWPTVASQSATAPYDDVTFSNVAGLQAGFQRYPLTSGAYSEDHSFDTDLYTQLVKLQHFNFAIPSDATITGIEVEMWTSWGYSAAPVVALLQLLNASGTGEGDNNGSDIVVTGETYQSYPSSARDVAGSSTNMWGVTLTPEMINDDDFGVQFSLKSIAYNAFVYVTCVGMRVYWYNSTSGNMFLCSGGDIDMDALIVGGGGAAGKNGSYIGGAGGAGGLLEGTLTNPDGLYIARVGAGGIAQTEAGFPGHCGGASTFGSHVALGGGGGGGASSSVVLRTPYTGGSGGGGVTYWNSAGAASTQGSSSPLTGYGYAGGNGGGGGSGGGGGAGGVGGSPTTAGAGRSSSITGSPVTYATGGVASGGGSGSAGTGDGGHSLIGTTGAGGSGVIILRYLTPGSAPVVMTAAISDITDSSATSGGTITDPGSSAITARGVCWNKTGTPTIADDFTVD